MTSHATKRFKGPPEYKTYPVLSTKTSDINEGDLCWWDAVTNSAKSALDFAWQGSLAKTQRAFARLLIGMSLTKSPANNVPAGTFDTVDKIRCGRFGAARLDCASTPVRKDSLIAIAQGTGNTLNPQKCVIVTDPSLAVGKAISDGAAQTDILFDIDAQFSRPTLPGERSYFADPGDVGAIPVEGYMDGVVLLKSAAAETRTIAAASAPGQRLSIGQETDAGDITLTFAADYDGTPHNTVVFSAVGQFIVLEAGPTKVWGLVVNRGAALSQV